MPRLSQEASLDKLLAESRPESRFVDLCVRFRRLTLLSAAPIPDDTVLHTAAGIEFKCRTVNGVIACASTTAGESAKLEAGEVLTWAGGIATLQTETVAEFGRRWDRLTKAWSADPVQSALVFDLMESQVAIVRIFQARWECFKAGKRHPKHSYFLVDDRAGGKSLICLLLVLAAKLDYPVHPDGAEVVVWLISVNHPASRELAREIRRWLPVEWYRLQEHPHHILHLAHGGQIILMSTDVPDDLKNGRNDLALLNEGAKMSSEPYESGIARTKDRRGFWLIPSNPPLRTKGAWISEVAEKAEEAIATGERNPVEFVACNSRLNISIDSESNADVRTVLQWISPARAAADAEGLIRPIGERLYRPPFSVAAHRKPFIEAEWAGRDITRLVTKQETGVEFDWIVTTDYQLRPGCVGTLAKIFGSREQPFFWILDDFWAEGSEDDLIDDMEEDARWVHAGGTPRVNSKNTLIVGDCSGATQNFKHEKGKDSFSVFQARGYRIVPCNKPRRTGPDAVAKNPPVDRTLGRVHTALKEGRLLFDPAAEMTIRSMKDCRFRKSITRIYAVGLEAHLTDTVRYLVWWATPPRRPANFNRGKIWSLKK